MFSIGRLRTNGFLRQTARLQAGLLRSQPSIPKGQHIRTAQDGPPVSLGKVAAADHLRDGRHMHIEDLCRFAHRDPLEH